MWGEEHTTVEKEQRYICLSCLYYSVTSSRRNDQLIFNLFIAFFFLFILFEFVYEDIRCQELHFNIEFEVLKLGRCGPLLVWLARPSYAWVFVLI